MSNDAGHYEHEATTDPTAHAEVLALRAVAQRLGRRVLDDHYLVGSPELCVM